MSFVLAFCVAAIVVVFWSAALAAMLACAVLAWMTVLNELRERRMRKRLQELEAGND